MRRKKTVIHEAIQNTFQNRPVSRHNARSSATRQRALEEFDGRFCETVELQLEQGNKFTMSLIRQTYSAGRFVCMFESYAYACTLFNAFVP